MQQTLPDVNLAALVSVVYLLSLSKAAEWFSNTVIRSFSRCLSSFPSAPLRRP